MGAMLLAATACGDDDPPLPEPPIVEPTPEPEPEPTPTDSVQTRTLLIRADWQEALSDADIPSEYRLRIGEETLVADPHILYRYSDSLATEPYELLAYNEPEGITLAEGMAAIRRTEEGELAALPGYFFTAAARVEVAKGDSTPVRLAMRRWITPITLRLHFTQPAQVKAVKATLSGLLPALRWPEGTPVKGDTDEAPLTRMAFEPMEGDAGIILQARSLGLREGARQLLSVCITLADGRALAFQTDLSPYLKPLEKREPIQLKNQIDTAKPEQPEPEPEPEPEPTPDPEPEPEPTPDPDVPADISAEIKDWEIEKGNDIEAK